MNDRNVTHRTSQRDNNVLEKIAHLIVDLYLKRKLLMKFILSTLISIFFVNCLIECKKEEPICVQHSETVGAYPCESRPTKEPLSLQYNKAQSDYDLICCR